MHATLEKKLNNKLILIEPSTKQSRQMEKIPVAL